MKKNLYFVPVDFSESSYNALQYTVMLAKVSGGTVQLCHVIDLDNLPESDNALVVSFALERLEKQAQEKMKSLCEIISLNGITVEVNIVTGRVRTTIMNQIQKADPKIIVLGKNTESQPRPNSLITYIAKHAQVPVLVVPGSHNPQVPNKAVLATDSTQRKSSEPATLIEFLPETKQLSVLIINNNNALKHEEHWIKIIKSTYGIDVKIIHQHPKHNNDIAEFIRTNSIHLMCIGNTAQSFISRFFKRNNEPEVLALESKIPVLVFNR
jgi:nucleotide-binding universal stress UspA family protein